ncbi:MAG: PKD domain-containing protein, partial [Methanoregulaceae archaeon]|nr:PKD domain-containing protein [Methanoregulaceae archaeon]
MESAHSSIIGVLLLITLVMVMGGIVSLMFSSQPVPDKVPIAYLSVSKTNDRVELMNKAGDTLTSSSVAIVVDGIDRTREFRAPENTPDWKTLPAGERIYFDSPQEPKSVQVVYVSNSGQYLLASLGPAPGTSMTPITTVTSPLPVPTIPVPAFPTVTHITPNSGYNGTNITTITMTGTSFLSGATVMLNGTGFSDISAINVTIVSPVQILCSFNLTGVPEGFRNVVVTNSDGNQGVLFGGFRVDGAESRPVVNFVATPGTGTAPLFVQFNDSSKGSTSSWGWSFGDGETSDSQNTSHRYVRPGNYSVNFTAIPVNGSTREIKTQYIIVKPPKPVANFTSNVTQIPVNGFVQFSDTSKNTPTSWKWTFGDDLFYDTHQHPVHQYINPGIFTVHLTVTNAEGSDSIIKTHYIQVMNVNHAPVLAQITNKTTTIGIPLTFIVTASDLDNSRLTFSAMGLPTGATFDPATRTFTWTPVDGMAGNYPVTFTVSDGTLNDSETCWIKVNALPRVPPIAQFTLNTTQGRAPLTVQFTDQSVSAGSVSYHWD